MITKRDRSIASELVELGIWKVVENMRLPDIQPTEETKPLFNAMKKRQKLDDLHHAPCCPANHYHNTRLVLSHCTCGAKLYELKANERLIRKRLYS